MAPRRLGVKLNNRVLDGGHAVLGRPDAAARLACSDSQAKPSSLNKAHSASNGAEQNIVLRSLREGIDTSNAAGRMVAGVLASLAELELELGRERRAAAREARTARGSPSDDPRRLTRRKPLWRSGCTLAGNRLAPLRRRWASVGPPSTACSVSRTKSTNRAAAILVEG
jgi:hypothetical protein